MKYVQIARDYYWFYGIICVNLLSPLAIAEWIEILYVMVLIGPVSSPLAIAEWIEINVVHSFQSSNAVSASDSGVG